MTLRIGIMGGMFDPVHRGHIEVALAALDLLQLDQLRMVPCGIPNHRKGALCSPAQRLEMLRLATQDNLKITVDSQELDRAGISYSYDTLVSIKAETSPSVLFLILGTDAFSSLPHWHRWNELFELCHFAVFSRPGSSLDPGSENYSELKKRQVTSLECFSKSHTGKIIIFDDLEIHTSSSVIRKRLGTNQPVENLLAPEVAKYLSDHKLYIRNL